MKLLVFIGTLVLTGCVSWGPMRTSTARENLNRLEIGMNKEEILGIMGQPLQREMFQDGSGRIYDVLIYQTVFLGTAVQPGDAQSTPLVIRDGRLIGWGRNFYDDTKRYEITLR